MKKIILLIVVLFGYTLSANAEEKCDRAWKMGDPIFSKCKQEKAKDRADLEIFKKKENENVEKKEGGLFSKISNKYKSIRENVPKTATEAWKKK